MIVPIAFEAKLAEYGSKHLALYHALREAIAEGLLPPGEKLPSTRSLAGLYGLSRGSVGLAYEMLAAEGYVRTGVGQGTFAAGFTGPDKSDKQGRLPSAAPVLSAWGRRLMDQDATGVSEPPLAAETLSGAGFSFEPRHIGQRWFPEAEWRSAVASVWRNQAEGPTASEGIAELRQAIAGRLRRERGNPLRSGRYCADRGLDAGDCTDLSAAAGGRKGCGR